MKLIYLSLFLVFCTGAQAQVSVVNQKGTRISIDSSKWVRSGTHIYNKNTGNTGIGNSSPAYKLDVTGKTRVSDSLVAGSARILSLPSGAPTDSMVVVDPATGVLKRVTQPNRSGGFLKTTSSETATTTTLKNIPGLSFTAQAGNVYRIRAWIVYEATGLTLLSGISLGPNFSGSGNWWYQITVNTTLLGVDVYTGYNTNTAINSNGSRSTSDNVALLTMDLECTSTGTFNLQFAKSTLTLLGNITVSPNSMVHYEVLNR